MLSMDEKSFQQANGEKSLSSSSAGETDGLLFPLKLDFEPNFNVLLTEVQGFKSTPIQVIEFEDVNYHRKNNKVELHGVSGKTRPGEMMSILGPSLAGKTKLLNVLAGTVQSSKQTSQVLSGVFIANESIQYYSVLRLGFVPKKENISAASTVKEELEFNATLRLPASVSVEERSRLVDGLLSGLGLEKVKSTQVKKLTKLQQKLLAVGIELASLPNVLCLDEPTSGLDLTSQWQLIQVLNVLAKSKACLVIASIQQPTSEVFASLTHTLLLSKGHVLFDGQAQAVSAWLKGKGLACPPNQNPADVALTCARMLPLERFVPPVPQDQKQLLGKKESVIPMVTNAQVKDLLNRPRHRSFFKELLELLKRDLRTTKRDPRLLLGRTIMTCIIMVLCACVFLHAGDVTSPTYFIGTHFGSFVFTMFSSCFGVMMPTVLFLFDIRGVYIRERVMNVYGTIPFAISKMAIELVVNFFIAVLCVLLMYWSAEWHGSFILIVVAYYLLLLSCLSWAYFLALALPNVVAGVGLTALVLIPQLLFMGTFVRIGSLPIWLQWVSYICNITYALRFVSVVEFDAANCGTNPVVCAQWQGIQATNLTYQSGLWWYAVVLVGFVFVLRGLGFLKIRNNIVHANRFGEL